MKKLLLILFICSFFFACSESDDKDTKTTDPDIIGLWEAKSGLPSIKFLYFSEDNKYKTSTEYPTTEYNYTGEYSIKNDKLKIFDANYTYKITNNGKQLYFSAILPNGTGEEYNYTKVE